MQAANVSRRAPAIVVATTRSGSAVDPADRLATNHENTSHVVVAPTIPQTAGSKRRTPLRSRSAPAVQPATMPLTTAGISVAALTLGSFGVHRRGGMSWCRRDISERIPTAVAPTAQIALQARAPVVVRALIRHL